MSRLMLIALLLAFPPLAGCTICQSPNDYDYSYFGGVAPRAHPSQGRAGSLFDDGSAAAIDGSAATFGAEPVWEDGEVVEFADGDAAGETVMEWSDESQLR